MTSAPGTIEWISSFKSDDVFYDVGANIGTYTIYGGQRVRKVIAFEPHIGNCMSLLRNVALNNLHNINIMSIALHNKTGFFDFNYYSTEIASSASQLGALDDAVCTEFKYASTIDRLIADGIEPPTHIKIDVDGNELLILQGMVETLRNKHIKSLQIELGPNKQQATNILSNYGYHIMSENFTHSGKIKLDNGADPDTIIHNVIYTK